MCICIYIYMGVLGGYTYPHTYTLDVCDEQEWYIHSLTLPPASSRVPCSFPPSSRHRSHQLRLNVSLVVGPLCCVYSRRMGQPTQRATNYTARSNIDTAQIFLHAQHISHSHSDIVEKRPTEKFVCGRVSFCFVLYISHTIQLTPQQLSAEPRNSASAEALAVARRPKDTSNEKTRPPLVSFFWRFVFCVCV